MYTSSNYHVQINDFQEKITKCVDYSSVRVYCYCRNRFGLNGEKKLEECILSTHSIEKEKKTLLAKHQEGSF